MTVASLFRPPFAATGIRRIIGATLVATSLLVAGCNTIKLAYDALPSLSYFWVDSYLDLDDTQTPKVKEELAALHQWHRRNELPVLADMLQRASRMAPRDVTADEVCAVYEEGRGRFVAFATHAEPVAAALVATLDAGQIKHLEKKYAKNNREFRKEWIDVSPQKRLDQRYKKVLERSEDFYGRLSDTQRAAVKEQVAASTFDPSAALAERMRRQQDALQTMQRFLNDKAAGKATTADAQREVHAWLQRGITSPDAGYRAYEDKLEKESCKAFAAAHATTTPEQREKARLRLLAYEKDLRDLAAR